MTRSAASVPVADSGMADTRQRVHVLVEGCVQGVGFRPFVYRAANACALGGWVCNSPEGARIEVEGAPEHLQRFATMLQTDAPPLVQISALQAHDVSVLGEETFYIRESEAGGDLTSVILPDIATCPDCLQDVLDPANRRYLYPFTNCTSCGPRFSIVNALPYDRCNTSMHAFPMCPACQAEYDDPANRRFHAQPNACPECGPQVALWNAVGEEIASRHDALLQVVERIRNGDIVAVKGIGGFHLLADAAREDAVQMLRQRKHRYEKPLALMVPDVQWARTLCHCSPAEEALLLSVHAPIVLLARHKAADWNLAPSVAGENLCLGIMLPYSPLHHILMRELGSPIVATSGNLSDEPICIDEHEALTRLSGIADSFLVHNRPVMRHVDDSVVRIFQGEPCMIRRARGYAPLPISWHEPLPPLLAVGAHQKNTIAITAGHHIITSQHIGDLNTLASMQAWNEVQQTLRKAYRSVPTHTVHDLHPDYAATREARSGTTPCMAVQHHHAHVLACMVEHGVNEPVLGIAWDGTGYGTDGTIWGGESLLVEGDRFSRAVSLQPFPLPGGEAAIQKNARIALGLLYACFGEDAFSMDWLPCLQVRSGQECGIDRTMLEKRINCPETTSMGRLFDAVASLIGLRHHVAYEGQAAVELEWLASDETLPPYPVCWDKEAQHASSPDTIPAWRIGLKPLVEAILHDVQQGELRGRIVTRFHATLVQIARDSAMRFPGVPVIVNGGCFQNRWLLEHVVQALQDDDIRVYWPRAFPANDGGIALGQIAFAAHALSHKE